MSSLSLLIELFKVYIYIKYISTSESHNCYFYNFIWVIIIL